MRLKSSAGLNSQKWQPICPLSKHLQRVSHSSVPPISHFNLPNSMPQITLFHSFSPSPPTHELLFRIISLCLAGHLNPSLIISACSI